ncbi:hypothetical protein KP003_06895 [Geomonas nitrogeniifigens]|uniref:hypothetical protein n=1 Tax=Geomonas diazotrophica TaxID=2843197 RepID=UPI001C2BD1F6|nr:hypothetical protein [Geomonas nitrogeniifigens]QXE88119.1 hypothetical protein KP003_06895 [Geomonas nitrogeniifigens]
MPRKLNIEFGNFVCKFGKKNLLDYAEAVIIPAFKSKAERKYGTTRYFFHEVGVFTVDDNSTELCIAGRIVKQTKLTREQIYDENNGIVKDVQAIETAPSALFALILNNHKLLYVHETAFAPDFVAFKATAAKVISVRHKQFIEEEYQRRLAAPKSGERITKARITFENPYPSIDLIPLSSKATLEDFIGQYRKLKSVEAKLIGTNSEIDLNGLFAGIRGTMDDIGSKSTIIRHQNSDGLNAQSALEQLNAAAGQGNTYINLNGEDLNGDNLKGDNNNFKLRVPITDISKKIRAAAKEMYDTFIGVKDSGLLVITEQDDESNRKVQALIVKGVADEQ